jgi:SPP1 family predicted phage head-tail adaptor
MTCQDFAARAKDRVTIQSQTQTADNYGGRTVSWVDVGTYWGIIEPLNARELVAQNAIQSRATHRAIIRWQTALKDVRETSDYRVSFDGRLFSVNGLLNLHADMKRHGREFQLLTLEENGPDVG